MLLWYLKFTLPNRLLEIVSNLQFITSSDYSTYLSILDRSVSLNQIGKLEVIPKIYKGEVEILDDGSEHNTKTVIKMAESILNEVCFDNLI